MKGKVTAFRYSDRTVEIEYKLNWFESTDKIDLKVTCDHINQMVVDFPSDMRNPFEETTIFIDGKRKFRVFLTVKEGIDIAFSVENLPILVGVKVEFLKK